jgi:hypothetical protein
VTGLYSCALLNNGTHCEKCILRKFHHPVSIIECTYTNLDGLAYYTPRLCDSLMGPP